MRQLSALAFTASLAAVSVSALAENRPEKERFGHGMNRPKVYAEMLELTVYNWHEKAPLRCNGRNVGSISVHLTRDRSSDRGNVKVNVKNKSKCTLSIFVSAVEFNGPSELTWNRFQLYVLPKRERETDIPLELPKNRDAFRFTVEISGALDCR